MENPKLVEDIIHALDIPGGSTKRRPVHTVGIGAKGFFEPSPIAQDFCTAKHFEPRTYPGHYDVDVRFSNGQGLVAEHDGWSDVRGMAVRFHLGEGCSTDLVSMTLPVFFAPDADTFLAFARAARPHPCRRETPWEKIKHYLRLELPMPDPYPGQTERPNEAAMAYAKEHLWAQPAVLDASAIGAPVSYVRADYHACHTFIVTGSDRQKRYVRFSWAPVAGVLNRPPTADPSENYLKQDLRDRLSKGTARFTLMMQIGETGDDFADSTKQWPPHRKRVMMGTLTLTEVPDEQTQKDVCERWSFNPWHLTPGIAPSEDPVLRLRKDAYEFSSNRRGGIPCPFHPAKG